ncbi:MAG: NrsF family protein [Pseudomonadota bacterium]
MNKRDELISELAADLKPVTGAPRPASLAMLSLIIGTAVTLALLLSLGELRPGLQQQVSSSPRFLLESIIGAAAVGTLFFSGLQLAVPAMHNLIKQVTIPLTLLSVWIGFYVYGLFDPALAPSMAGKREHCWLETLLVAMPPLVIAFYICSRLYPLRGRWSGFLLGLGAGAIPALVMQFTCMYQAQHILTHHLLPGLTVGLVGVAAGSVFLRPK